MAWVKEIKTTVGKNNCFTLLPGVFRHLFNCIVIHELRYVLSQVHNSQWPFPYGTGKERGKDKEIRFDLILISV